MKDTQTDSGEEPETRRPDEPGEEDTGSAWIQHRRRRPLVRRVGGRVGGHVESRFAYGILTLSTFGFTAGALLVVIAVVGAIVYAAEGRLVHALAFLVIGLVLAVVAAALGFGAGFIGLPFAGDWFLEWPSHVIAWALAIAGCALMAALIFLTPLPAFAGVLLTIVGVFGAGYTLAYALRVTSPPAGNQGARGRKR